MKNIIILIFSMSLLCSSCKKEPIENFNIVSTTYPTHKATLDVVTIDSFNDENLKAYIRSYETYIEEYAQFVATRDMKLLDSLHTIGEELTTKITTITEDLSEREINQLNIYMEEKSLQLQELSKQLEE